MPLIRTNQDAKQLASETDNNESRIYIEPLCKCFIRDAST